MGMLLDGGLKLLAPALISHRVLHLVADGYLGADLVVSVEPYLLGRYAEETLALLLYLIPSVLHVLLVLQLFGISQHLDRVVLRMRSR